MLPTKVRLLDSAATTPHTTLSGGTVDDGVLIEDLVIDRNDKAGGTDDAVR